MNIGKLNTMLKWAYKKYKQRKNKPLTKHANDTFKKGEVNE